MRNKVIGLLKNTWGLLIFALVAGCAYYAVVLKFILAHTSAGGGLLGFFFAPLIICGAALVLVKIIKQCFENETENKAVVIFWAHVLFIAVAAVLTAAMFA